MLRRVAVRKRGRVLSTRSQESKGGIAQMRHYFFRLPRRKSSEAEGAQASAILAGKETMIGSCCAKRPKRPRLIDKCGIV